MGKRTKGKAKQPIDFPLHVTRELRKTAAEEEARGEREESSEEAAETARAAATALHTTPLHGETDVAQGRVVTTAEAKQTTSAGEEEKREEPELPAVLSADESTPLEGGDFTGAEGSAEMGSSEPIREGGSSPPDNLETHAPKDVR